MKDVLTEVMGGLPVRGLGRPASSSSSATASEEAAGLEVEATASGSEAGVTRVEAEPEVTELSEVASGAGPHVASSELSEVASGAGTEVTEMAGASATEVTQLASGGEPEVTRVAAGRADELSEATVSLPCGPVQDPSLADTLVIADPFDEVCPLSSCTRTL